MQHQEQIQSERHRAKVAFQTPHRTRVAAACCPFKQNITITLRKNSWISVNAMNHIPLLLLLTITLMFVLENDSQSYQTSPKLLSKNSE